MKARVIAFYLPQFHPTVENDKFWGKGFTEWINVAKAKPLFRGHNQPRIPADLGFYDLRMPEIREEQAKLAKEAGIEGFCYWHYWFGNGIQTLERPFNEVLESKEPDFPFCLGWANHSWTTKTWDKGKSKSDDTMIFEQKYPGVEDYKKHFYEILPALKDKRYITVDGKPLFYIWDPNNLPNPKEFINLWKKLAYKNGLQGMYFIAKVDPLGTLGFNNIKNVEDNFQEEYQKILNMGFDAVNSHTLKYAELNANGKLKKIFHALVRKYFSSVFIEKYKYKDIIRSFNTKEDFQENIYPQLIPGRDRSPRSGKKAVIYYENTPEEFRIAVKNAISCVEKRNSEHRIIFLNSWNEWAEGAYMEPDTTYGKSYIQVLREELEDDE
ncbi:glycoside hydrolase family 99-like domain-containing protein [Streptococcus sp. IsoGale021]|uniref:glycosyltransferase WbsX family protein n=1 Tax=Streptococcus TaxID=1301 RepID=UPI0020014F1B|nr:MULTISPECIES: glycoside hydrolase family 99-like domain-containing protein [Streptococcus]MCY7209835.1 glycoside hydrolase family 99-like domain-containing protein [Streptococcus anginosus]MCY7211412.1 glycoside hydrolase family 99-like domain-containing protein [Streptococcus anginosus]MCY7226539.1 glycoside hydrolase family 99-like domain-containing protein [Streptococcus anginosus]MDQ8693902.1 glycoside hydrolase family 99-like domain-containing protein [Streptococcus sp. IsoGale021]MDU5